MYIELASAEEWCRNTINTVLTSATTKYLLDFAMKCSLHGRKRDPIALSAYRELGDVFSMYLPHSMHCTCHFELTLSCLILPYLQRSLSCEESLVSRMFPAIN